MDKSKEIIKQFEENIISKVEPGNFKTVNVYDFGQQVTTAHPDDGDAFMLHSPDRLTINKPTEVVKRIAIGFELVEKVNENPEEFVYQLNKYIEKLGLLYYTLKRPNGSNSLRLLENQAGYELRIVGIK